MAMRNHLAGCRSRRSEPCAHDDIVEAAFEDAQEVLGIVAARLEGELHILGELLARYSVAVASLLLFEQLLAVFALLTTAAFLVLFFALGAHSILLRLRLFEDGGAEVSSFFV